MTDTRELKFTPPMTLKFPAAYDDRGKALLPAGTENVEVAYGASSKTYKKNGKTLHQNVYRYNGELYNL